MPLVHRLLYALRALADDEPPPSRRKHKSPEALADDEPPPSRRKHKSPERSSTRHRQAVALVITFRDLFASSGLNFLLEDMEANRTCRKMKYNNSQYLDTPKCTLKNEYNTGPASIIPNKVEICETLKVALESERPLATSDSMNFLTDSRDDALSHDERIIASSGLPDYSSAESPSRLLVPVNPGSPSRLLVPVNPGSPSRLLVPVNPGEREKGRRNLTVLLSPEDENKTVDALRKVLKWSPRKQSLAKFSVPLPKEEEHRAVAVVQNAVNRVKEEQQQKRKRKFKLTFC